MSVANLKVSNVSIGTKETSPGATQFSRPYVTGERASNERKPCRGRTVPIIRFASRKKSAATVRVSCDRPKMPGTGRGHGS